MSYDDTNWIGIEIIDEEVIIDVLGNKPKQEVQELCVQEVRNGEFDLHEAMIADLIEFRDTVVECLIPINLTFNHVVHKSNLTFNHVVHKSNLFFDSFFREFFDNPKCD